MTGAERAAVGVVAALAAIFALIFFVSVSRAGDSPAPGPEAVPPPASDPAKCRRIMEAIVDYNPRPPHAMASIGITALTLGHLSWACLGRRPIIRGEGGELPPEDDEDDQPEDL